MTRADGHRRGAVLLRVDGALQFLPASTAVHVGPVPRVTALPGSPPELLGVAIHEGTIVPVVSIGTARAEMIVCQHAGEILGVIGGQVVRTGLFDVVPGQPEKIVHEGEAAEAVDLTTIYARIQASSRPGRWGA
jgi:hypothetical protein